LAFPLGIWLGTCNGRLRSAINQVSQLARAERTTRSCSSVAHGARFGARTARTPTCRLPPPVHCRDGWFSPIPPRTPAGGTPNLQRVFFRASDRL